MTELFCKRRSCKFPLLEIARTEYKDGMVCGEGEQEIFYQCSECERLYHRFHFADGDTNKQRFVHKCDQIPRDAFPTSDIDIKPFQPEF